jgi:hypothetical protein
MGRLMMMVVSTVLVFAGVAQAGSRPRYDVPPGFTACPHAIAWNGFFKWASERHTNCRGARRYMRVYAAHATGPRMPHHVGGFRCNIHYWRSADNEIYASRHTCIRGRMTIRFYGMV